MFFVFWISHISHDINQDELTELKSFCRGKKGLLFWRLCVDSYIFFISVKLLNTYLVVVVPGQLIFIHLACSLLLPMLRPTCIHAFVFVED